MRLVCARRAGMAFACAVIASTAHAQKPASTPDKHRADFEHDIRTVALERDVESDALLLMYALKLRQSDERAFLAAMKVLGERGLKLKIRQCEKLRSPELCAFSAGVYLEVVGRSEIAWEYARIAKSFTDKTPGLDAVEIAETYRWLAKFERKAGFIGKAAELEKAAEAKLAADKSRPANAVVAANASPNAAAPTAAQAPAPDPNESPYVRLAATSGRVPAVRAAIEDAIGPKALKPTGLIPDRAVHAFDFVASNLGFIFTSPEFADVRQAVSAELPKRMLSALISIAVEMLNTPNNLPEPLFVSLIAETRRLADADQYVNSKWLPGLDKLYPAKTKYFREQAYLFCWAYSFECRQNGFGLHRSLSLLLSSSDLAVRSKAFKEFVEQKANEGMGLNDANDIEGFLAGMELGRRFGVLTQDRWLARTFANEYLARAQKHGGGSWAEVAQGRIVQLLPIYVWLARDAAAGGRRADAVKHLAEAERHVQTRLSREWRSGGVKAAETLVALRPGLRELADARAAIYPSAQPQDSLRAAELAFSTMQYPQIADVALEILANAQKRGSNSAELQKALAAREQLSSELARIDTMVKTKLGYQNPGEAAAAKAAIGEKIKAADARVKAASPAGVATTSLEPLSLASVTALVRPGEVLIGSVVAEERTSFVMLAGGHTYLWQVPLGRAGLAARIGELRRGIDGDQANFPLQAAHKLFVELLGPVQQQLLAADHALLAVDGPLLGLPFQMLLTEPPPAARLAPADYRKGKLAWLARGPAISVLPSLRAIEALRKSPSSKATLAFAGIGNPVLAGEQGKLRNATVARLMGTRGLIDAAQLKRLEPLPETADELARVAKVIGGRREDLFLREKASETVVKRTDLSRYRIISFATHGLMAGDISGLVEPALVLTPPAQPTPQDDGLLTTSEIAALKLDTELVILSACNTAAADGTPQAEGLSGLTRAFFAAGSRGVIASHWPVASDSTVLLMTRAAAHKSSGAQMTWAKALKAAMLELIDKEGEAEYAHPAYWAPFVAVGAG